MASDSISLRPLIFFLRQVINYRGIPFDLRLPNKETQHAMDDINNRRNLESADTVEEMFEKIGTPAVDENGVL